MADAPRPVLEFDGGCPDGGQRQVPSPQPTPDVGDDFEWRARDYDGIRLAMLEELAARFPERTRWTPADLEVVLVEALATALDQLSDMADRVTAEAYLETARRPESVRRLLGLIGYDAVALARLSDDPPEQPNGLTGAQKLERAWADEPLAIERARRAGPRAVHSQRRMVTVEDYTLRLEEHPIIRRAAARARWTGSWTTLQVAVVLRWPNTFLDDPVAYDGETRTAIEIFHGQRSLVVPDWQTVPPPTHRMVMEPLLEAYRMVGQEVVLDDARPVGIALEMTVEVGERYFQSEVRRALAEALGTQPGGLFEPGHLRFGEDLHASDLFQTLLRLEGVLNVCLTRFKRVGNQHPDQAASGRIRLDGLEIAVCDNDPRQPDRGYYRITLRGGRKG
jgi:hypothetical protein